VGSAGASASSFGGSSALVGSAAGGASVAAAGGLQATSRALAAVKADIRRKFLREICVDIFSSPIRLYGSFFSMLVA
jgi:hypothetical protein